MIKIKYHSDLKEVQSNGALDYWLSDACQTAPFDRLAWWRDLSIHCNLAPVIAIAHSDHAASGDNWAVLALSKTARAGHLTALANWYTFRFRPLVSGPDALLNALAADLKSQSHRITVSALPDEDGSASALETAFRSQGWLVRRRVADTNHILPLDGETYDAYLTTRPGKLRTTLKRKSNKVQTKIFTNFDEDAWISYEEIYAESWKPEEGSPDFLKAFARAEGAAGRLRLALAHPGDDPNGPAIAAQMWTVEGGTAFIHKLAHREAAKPLSPGSVLTAALMRHVIEVDRVSLVDFGTGDDPYKRDWMSAQRPRYQLDMFRPFAPQNWLTLLKIGVLSVSPRLAATFKRR